MKLYAHCAAHTQKVMKMENFLHRNRTFLPGKLLIYLRIRLPTFFLSPTFYFRSRKIVSVNPCSQSILVPQKMNALQLLRPTHQKYIAESKSSSRLVTNRQYAATAAAAATADEEAIVKWHLTTHSTHPTTSHPAAPVPAPSNRSAFLTEVPVYYILPCRLKTDYVARQTSYRNQGTREE